MEWGLSSTHKEVDGDEEVDDGCQSPGGKGSELSGQVLPQKSADELQAILVVLVRISPPDLVRLDTSGFTQPC